MQKYRNAPDSVVKTSLWVTGRRGSISRPSASFSAWPGSAKRCGRQGSFRRKIWRPHWDGFGVEPSKMWGFNMV